MKTKIETDHKVISTFIFTEKELIRILVNHINLSLGQTNGFQTAIRDDDCIFRPRYDAGYMIESERTIKHGDK